MLQFFKVSKEKALIEGGLLLGLALVWGYLGNSVLSSRISLSPGDVLASKIYSLPTTSFFVLVAAVIAVVLLGVAGVIFLIVGLSQKED